MNGIGRVGMATDGDDRQGWRREGRGLVRGVAAGAIVGVPLLYTMEMWWHGMVSAPGHLLILLGVTLLINFFFCLASGFRETYSLGEAAMEAVTSVGLAMVVSLGVLLAIRSIDLTESPGVILGMVAIEALPVSLGISFANSKFRGKSRQGEQGGSGGDGPEPSGEGDGVPPHEKQLRQDVREFAATLIGATVFSFNIAPTQEVILIASRVPAWQQLLIVLGSLGLCYLILFASEFQERRVYVPGLFQRPWVEVIMAYGTSLAVAGLLLYLVGVPQATSSFSSFVQCAVTLGLPAVVGGAAGRLVS